MSNQAKLKNLLDQILITNQEINDFSYTGSHLNHSQAQLLQNQEFTINSYLPQNTLFDNVIYTKAPTSVAQLLHYASNIAGLTVSQLAQRHNLPLIKSLNYNKGWLGNLIEIALGATAGSKPTQDFENLGIELKTVAININGNVNNDIFVSSLPFNTFALQNWYTSHVLYKLEHVLFVPVESNSKLPLSLRHIGQGVLWRPSQDQLQRMHSDWSQILQLIQAKEFNLLSSGVGDCLCVRTKALNSNQFNFIEDIDGFTSKLPPLSFYLRRSFVNEIFEQIYKI